MRSFLFTLCIASLLFSSVGVANVNVAAKSSGKVATLFSKATKAGATLVLGAMLACGLTGCDQGKKMAGDVIGVKATMDNPVKFGVIYEHEFQQSFAGVKLAANEINMAGGINGRYLELIPHKIYGQNRSDVVRAAVYLTTYDEVLGIIGANRSTLSEFVDEVAAQLEVPMLAIGSTSATLTRASEWVFLTAYSDSFTGDVMASHAVKNIGAKTAAVIYWREDAYSKGLADSFRDSFIGLGGDVVAYRGYSYATEQGNDTFAMELNESGIVSEVAAAMPDMVFIPGFSESAIVAIELREAGEDAVFLGADAWGLEELIKLGGAAVEGAYFSDHFTSDAAPEFTANYKSAYGVEPDGLGALGYDAMGVAGQAAQRAAMAGELTRMTLRDEINATENYMGATNILRYDENRHPIKSAVIFTIEGGEKVFVMTVDP